MLEASGDGREAAARRRTSISPEQAADAVVAGLADGGFLILPHPEVAGYYAARATDPDRWQGQMRKLQRLISSEDVADAGTGAVLGKASTGESAAPMGSEGTAR